MSLSTFSGFMYALKREVRIRDELLIVLGNRNGGRDGGIVETITLVGMWGVHFLVVLTT